jgi:hypothetical protein
MTGICVKCGGTNDRSSEQKYCRPCHAAYQREWRKSHRLTGESRVRQTARAYARTYLNRGMIEILPCSVCGSPESEMHHPDHSRPLFIYWLCRDHHLAWHAHERATPGAKLEEWLPPGAAAARIGHHEYIALSRETNAAYYGHPRA